MSVTKHATENTETENRTTFRLQRKHAAKQRLQSGYKIRIATYSKSGFNFQVSKLTSQFAQGAIRVRLQSTQPQAGAASTMGRERAM